VKIPRDRRRTFNPIVDFLVEDILSVSDDQLLAEAAEDCGSPGAFAAELDAITHRAILGYDTAASKQGLSVAANGTPQQEAVALFDVIVEDILSMSDDQLLAEAAVDYGSPGALVAEFDAITSPVISSYNNSVIKKNDVPATGAAPGSIRAAAIAVLSEWLARPLGRRAALGAFATLLLITVLTPGIYLLLVDRAPHEKALDGPDHLGPTRAFQPAARPDAKGLPPIPSNRSEQPAPPVASEPGARQPEAAPNSAEAACAKDMARLTRLRADPTIGAIAQFERELACERIRPQLRRLRESVGQ
jgi:hypothetical protein